MKLTDLAIRYNKSRSYFYVMKKDHKDKYDLIFSFDKDNTKSINLYMEYVEILKADIQKIFFEYEHRKDFGIFLIEHNFYENKEPNSVATQFEKGLFSSTEPLSEKITMLKKYERIREVYNEHKSNKRSK